VNVRLYALLLVLVLALAGCEFGGDDERAARGSTAAEATSAPATTEAAETTTGPATTAPEAAPPERSVSIPAIVDELQPSVVSIVLSGGEGSGVILEEDVIVTNYHVVRDTPEVQVVLADGRRLQARVQASDERTDLALLSLPGAKLPPARLAEELPEVGELAIAIGNPLGFENTVTAGIVSGLHRAIPSGGQNPALIDLIQTDAAISPGNSGGALVNGAGEVIGINVAYIPPESRAVSIGFAIPAPTVRSVVRQLQENGRVRHSFLGIRPGELTPQLAERFGIDAESGVIVVFVTDGSPADLAGLRAGDVIVALDGDEIASVEDLLGRLREREPGTRLRVAYLRDGDRREVDATLAEREDP
jgi:S1-C subfamily serine protease